MGSKSDPESVVDEKLKVLATNGLRVIDASIMPTSIEPETYGTCVMIGEKGAKLIIDDYQ
jgi:choline dehydrogenase-like flavoprotein